MLSEMEMAVTNKLTFKFSGLYPYRGIFLWTLEIKRICMGRRRFAIPLRSIVFHTNPCNFASFQAAIKSSPFGLRA